MSYFPFRISPGWRACAAACLLLLPVLSPAAPIFHAQGEMAGEPGDTSILLQTRLTATDGLGGSRTVPGARGVARFLVREDRPGSAWFSTPWQRAEPETDFIVRQSVTTLRPDTRYVYKLEFGPEPSQVESGPDRSFRTLPGAQGAGPLAFLFFNCMGWGQYTDGYGNRPGYAGADKALGYPTLVQMRKYADAHFMIGGGDLVYYDLPSTDVARTLPQLRAKWQQQFSQPRLVDLVGSIGAYWMKDDHDFRYDDADRTGTREPSAELGIRTFREQMPVVPPGASHLPTYRTIRASRHAQLWLLEGRDYRSPNRMEDGPAKSIWGPQQRDWLQRTLVESDATWRLIITPTPLVGPDGARKRDNHTNPLGFRHERESFFSWMKQAGLRNVVLFTGDRHWQYHSIHPTGYSEFACGSLHREIAVGNPPRPGDPESTDPAGLIDQRYVTPKQDGGFLRIVIAANGGLRVEVIDQDGAVRYVHEEASRAPAASR